MNITIHAEDSITSTKKVSRNNLLIPETFNNLISPDHYKPTLTISNEVAFNILLFCDTFISKSQRFVYNKLTEVKTMDFREFLTFFIPFALGFLSYFLVSRLFKRKTLINAGAIFYSIVTIGFFIVSKTTQDSMGFAALGYFIMALLAFIALVGYLLAWLIDYLIKKKRTV